METVIIGALLLMMGGVAAWVVRDQAQYVRDMQRKLGLAQVQLALELYSQSHGKRYPDDANLTPAENYQALAVDLVPLYIKELPQDPLARKPFVFEYRSRSAEQASYELDARLEVTRNHESLNSADGGNENDRYELGTDLSLISAGEH